MDRPIVAFDTETATCRGAPHVIEIGAVRAVDGEIVDRFEALVRPEVAVDPAVTEVHGLTDDDLRDAPPVRDVLLRFAAWIGDDWLVAHNAGFDAMVLAFEAARVGVVLPRAPILDTLKLARHWIPEAPDHKLGTLIGHLELEVGVHHRALPDALGCWLVFDECRARLAADPRGAEVVASGGSWADALARGGGRLTFANAAPRTPRITRRLRALGDACAERMNVSLHYAMDDGALARLPVAPRLLYELGEHAYLEAECLRSGILKTYRLDRIRGVQS